MSHKPRILSRAEGGTGLGAAGASGNVLTSDGTDWTSAAPAGGGGDYTFTWSCTNSSPADSTTYYLAPNNAILTASSLGSRFYVPIDCTLTRVYGAYVAGTPGSAQNVTLAIRVNDTTNTNITTTLQVTSTSGTYNNTGLSLSLSAGDFLDFVMVTPVWTTNPLTFRLAATAYMTV